MNITNLRYALEVAKAGSINKAAENLYMSQSSLSRAIKEFEASIGIEIFERNARGIHLTFEGEKLIREAKKLVKQIDKFESAFRTKAETKQIFSFSGPRSSYIASAFADFSNLVSLEEPIEIVYMETNPSKVIDNVSRANYRLGVIRYAENLDKYYKSLLNERHLTYNNIASFRYKLVVNKNCPLAGKNEIFYSDLSSFIEITHPDTDTPTVAFSDVRKNELPDITDKKIYVYERGSQFDVLSSNPNAYMWVSPIPPELLEKQGLVELECVENEKKYYDTLIYSKDYDLSEIDKIFIDKLTESARRMNLKAE